MGEIGAPPLDVPGVSYLLHGMKSFDKRHRLESTRRTLENMVAGGLLERVTVYEQRQNTTQSNADSPVVWCNVVRYGLPGWCRVIRDTSGADNSISGACGLAECRGYVWSQYVNSLARLISPRCSMWTLAITSAVASISCLSVNRF